MVTKMLRYTGGNGAEIDVSAAPRTDPKDPTQRCYWRVGDVDAVANDEPRFVADSLIKQSHFVEVKAEVKPAPPAGGDK